MLRKRMLVLVTVLMLLAVVFGACAAPVAAPSGDTGTGEAAAGGEAGPVTITWAMWGSPAEIETHQAVADAFMAEQDAIKVEILSEPWGDYFTRIQALWASGDSSVIPDVLFLSPVVNYAAEGVLQPLDDLIAGSDYNLDDYWPGLIEFASYEGQVYGFPRDSGLEVLYYNKDIFDEVGIEYPTDSWTWDDLTTAAEALSIVDANGRVERYGLAMEGGKYPLWILQNMGLILDDMNDPSSCQLDQPAAMDAIKFFAGLMDAGYAMRPAELNQAGGDAAVFQSGQAAMIIQNASRISAFNAADMNYDVSVIPIPEGGQRASSNAGAAWVMSAMSDNKDAAWTFLQWLQSTDGGQRIYTESGEILPALISTAKSDAFLGMDTPPANRQAFITEGENGKVGRVGYFAEWNELSGSIISPALDTIWAGEAAPEDVLPALCEQVNAFLAENGYPK